MSRLARPARLHLTPTTSYGDIVRVCSAGKLQLKREDSELMESSEACFSSPAFVQQPQTESLWVVALRWGAPRAFQQPAAVESGMVATTPAPSWQQTLHSALLAFLPAAPHYSAAVNTSAGAAASRGTAASSPPAENRDASAACRANSGDPDPPTTTAAAVLCGPQARSLMRLPLAAVVTVASPSVTQPPPTDAEATVTDPAAALQLSTPEPPSPAGRGLQLPDDATEAVAPRSGEEAAIVADEGGGGSAAGSPLRSSPVVQPALQGGGGLDEAALLSFIEKDAAEGEWLTVCKLAASADCRRTVAGVATEMTACGLLWHDLLMITATTAGSGSWWHNRT